MVKMLNPTPPTTASRTAASRRPSHASITQPAT